MAPVKKKRGVLSVLETSNVAASSNADSLLPPGGAVPVGRTVRVTRFGGSDVSDGDGVASEIILQVTEDGASFQTLRRVAVNGSTFSERLDRTWESNGNLRFRLRRRNNGVATKRISAWIDGFRKVSA